MKSPPAPPDYTEERADFAQSELANRRKIADAWNQEVNDYNSQLGGYLSQLNGIDSQVDDLTIRDIDQFDSFRDQLNSIGQTALTSAFTKEKPFFESMVNSPYGAVQVGTPQLNSINNQLKTQIQSSLSGLEGALANLEAQRNTEEERIRDFRNNLLTQASQANSTLGGLTIADIGQMNALRTALDSLDTARSTFSSSILDQLYPNGFSQVASSYNLARAGLQDLFAQRAAEEQRIADYRAALQGSQDEYISRLSGLDIADADALEQLKREIDQRQLGASRFSSLLNPNFDNTLFGIQEVENNLDALIAEREAELRRIDQAQGQAGQAASTIEQTLANAGIYNLSNLNSIQQMIDASQQGVADFTSELNPDFSAVSGRLTAAEEALAELMSQRNAQIGGINEDITGLLSSLEGTDLWNQGAFEDAIENAQGFSRDLLQFSGSDTIPVQQLINDAMDMAQNRLTELGEYRSGIETDAQDFLDELAATSFYGDADFVAPEARLEDLIAERDLYDAGLASDEIAQIQAFLQSQRNRLAQDAAAAAENAALEASGFNPYGNSNTSAGNDTLMQQFLNWLASQGEDDVDPAAVSAFARALGVIKA